METMIKRKSMTNVNGKWHWSIAYFVEIGKNSEALVTVKESERGFDNVKDCAISLEEAMFD